MYGIAAKRSWHTAPDSPRPHCEPPDPPFLRCIQPSRGLDSPGLCQRVTRARSPLSSRADPEKVPKVSSDAMPTHPDKHTIGHNRRGHKLGLVDSISNVYRTCAATFVSLKYKWGSGKSKTIGEVPARLSRIFVETEEDDDDDSEPAQIEHSFSWDYKSIVKIKDYDVHIDAATLDMLRDNPRAWLESVVYDCSAAYASATNAFCFALDDRLLLYGTASPYPPKA